MVEGHESNRESAQQSRQSDTPHGQTDVEYTRPRVGGGSGRRSATKGGGHSGVSARGRGLFGDNTKHNGVWEGDERAPGFIFSYPSQEGEKKTELEGEPGESGEPFVLGTWMDVVWM